jgi:hypothetical protein
MVGQAARKGGGDLEARRCVSELGAVAVIGTPNPVNGQHLHDEVCEPLWKVRRINCQAHRLSRSATARPARVPWRGSARTARICAALGQTGRYRVRMECRSAFEAARENPMIVVRVSANENASSPGAREPIRPEDN